MGYGERGDLGVEGVREGDEGGEEEGEGDEETEWYPP